MARGDLKFPPDGVETAPTSHDIVPLRAAARLLGKDHRTVRLAIIQGRIRGGAEPHPQRCRWYVYADQLPVAPPAVSQPPAAPLDVDRDADQKAQITALTEAVSLVLASNAEILAAVDDYKAATEATRSAAAASRLAEEKFQSAADGFRSALSKHRDALAQLTTPGHLGELGPLN